MAAALLVLGGVLLLADFTPVMAGACAEGPASSTVALSALVGRLALAPTCHQRPERSFLVASKRMAACARCTGLYAGSMLAGILVLAGARLRPGAGRAVVLASLAAMALDVAAGIAWPSWDHPMLRFATGLAVVASTGLAAAAVLTSVQPPESNQSLIVASTSAPR